MKKISLAILALVIIAGCKSKAQVPPTPPTIPTVVLTWTAPANCTGCAYIISAITVPTGTSTCPVPNTTTPNYTPLNQSSPVSATTITETPNPTPATICYIAQTVQNGSYSIPSNTAGPIVVPAAVNPPAAPTSLSGK